MRTNHMPGRPAAMAGLYSEITQNEIEFVEEEKKRTRSSRRRGAAQLFDSGAVRLPPPPHSSMCTKLVPVIHASNRRIRNIDFGLKDVSSSSKTYEMRVRVRTPMGFATYCNPKSIFLSRLLRGDSHMHYKCRQDAGAATMRTYAHAPPRHPPCPPLLGLESLLSSPLLCSRASAGGMPPPSPLPSRGRRLAPTCLPARPPRALLHQCAHHTSRRARRTISIVQRPLVSCFRRASHAIGGGARLSARLSRQAAEGAAKARLCAEYDELLQQRRPLFFSCRVRGEPPHIPSVSRLVRRLVKVDLRGGQNPVQNREIYCCAF